MNTTTQLDRSLNISFTLHSLAHTYTNAHKMSISAQAAARLAKVLPSLDSITTSQLTVKPQLTSYFVPRTSAGNLPVYKTYRSQAAFTDIKRVQGNVVQLRNDLQAALPHINEYKYNCFTVSGSLRIKGDYVAEVKQVLEQKF
jgi:large subunit ribosomal protein L49